MSLGQRERLLERHRYINVEHNDWYDCVYSDFREDMKKVGVDVERMYFTGFCSHGDGACFNGKLDNAKTYLDHHHAGQYPMLRKLLEHDGGVYIRCEHRGRYFHQYCTEFWVDADTLTHMVDQPTEFHETIVEQWQRQLEDEVTSFEVDVKEQWWAYMSDLYCRLENEYYYLVSDEAVWETIEANELDEDDEELED